MKRSVGIVLACLALLPFQAGAQQQTAAKATAFQPVPELPYRMVPSFFKFPKGMVPGEASAVAVNSKGHIFLFQRTKPMLAEYDAKGNFIQSIGDGLFTIPTACALTPTIISGLPTTAAILCSNWTRPAMS